MAGYNGFVSLKKSGDLIQMQPDCFFIKLYINPHAFGRFVYCNGLVIICRKFTHCLVDLPSHTASPRDSCSDYPWGRDLPPQKWGLAINSLVSLCVRFEVSQLALIM